MPSGQQAPIVFAVTIAVGNALLQFVFAIIVFSSGALSDDFLPGHMFRPSTKVIALIAPLVGALIIGWIADRTGRRPGLVASFVLMGIGTLGTAITPSYSAIGVSASVFFFCFRVLQFVAWGGEFGAAATALFETASKANRGRFVSLIPATSDLSTICALLFLLGVSDLLDAHAMRVWGWRLAFLLGSTILPLALLARQKSMETLVRRAEAPKRWKGRNFGIPLLAFFVFAALFAAQYLSDFITALIGSAAGAASAAAMAIIFTAVLGVVFSLIGGWLSDTFGPKRAMVASFVTLVVSMVTLLAWKTIDAPAVSGLAALTIYIATIAIMRALAFPAAIVALSELFGPNIRSRGLGLTYTAASVALAIYVGPGGRPLLIGDVIDMTFVCVCGLFAMMILPKASSAQTQTNAP
jgi:MFS transporter, MHS family, citrate/tricarballylate:H+ symporter